MRDHELIFWWLGIVSVATLVVSALQFVEYSLRNVLGAILLVAGIAMLVLPGQGVPTILISLGLMNFPGKYRLER